MQFIELRLLIIKSIADKKMSYHGIIISMRFELFAYFTVSISRLMKVITSIVLLSKLKTNIDVIPSIKVKIIQD